MHTIYNYNSGQLSVSKRYQRTTFKNRVQKMFSTAFMYEIGIAGIVVYTLFAYYNII